MKPVIIASGPWLMYAGTVPHRLVLAVTFRPAVVDGTETWAVDDLVEWTQNKREDGTYDFCHGSYLPILGAHRVLADELPAKLERFHEKVLEFVKLNAASIVFEE